jgi:hypothetical protein
LIDQLAAEV